MYETWIRLYEACKCRRVSQRTWSLSTEQSHSIDEHLYSPYDHGRRSRGTGDLERGTLMQIVPQILSYRYKNERSVAFKIRQNPFSAGALPRTPLGELTMLPQIPQSAGEGPPLPIPRPTLHGPTFGARHTSPRSPARSTPMHISHAAAVQPAVTACSMTAAGWKTPSYVNCTRISVNY